MAQVALDDLGYSPCFHARFFPYLTEFFDTLYDHVTGRRPDFPAKRLFRQFNSAVDIPAPLIPMVMEAYPDAKVGNSFLAVNLKSSDAPSTLTHICLSASSVLSTQA